MKSYGDEGRHNGLKNTLHAMKKETNLISQNVITEAF